MNNIILKMIILLQALADRDKQNNQLREQRDRAEKELKEEKELHERELAEYKMKIHSYESEVTIPLNTNSIMINLCLDLIIIADIVLAGWKAASSAG